MLDSPPGADWDDSLCCGTGGIVGIELLGGMADKEGPVPIDGVKEGTYEFFGGTGIDIFGAEPCESGKKAKQMSKR